jgi:SAM-dependent methyltransferase
MSSLLFPAKQDPQPPIPPGKLSAQVLGHAASVENFLYGGFIVSEGVKGALQLIGRPLETFRNVLDFGCGPARILRWFAGYSASCRFAGSDISRAALDWNRQHLPFGEFVENQREPPLPFAGQSFDLVYAVSVVTHLGEDLQFAWLQEIQRLLCPGGIAMLTVMGEELAAWKLAPEELAAFQRKGHFYKSVQPGGLHGLPDFYQDAYHSRSYVVRQWSRYFRPLAYIRNGPMFFQDLAILEKPRVGDTVESWPKGSHPRAGGSLDLALPFGGIYQPKIADTITSNLLRVSGWSFQHRAGSVALKLSIDGRDRASCVANDPSPALAMVYPPAAGQRRGFTALVPLDGLSTGPHVLQCRAEGTTLPYVSTYFFMT